MKRESVFLLNGFVNNKIGQVSSPSLLIMSFYGSSLAKTKEANVSIKKFTESINAGYIGQSRYNIDPIVIYNVKLMDIIA